MRQPPAPVPLGIYPGGLDPAAAAATLTPKQVPATLDFSKRADLAASPAAMDTGQAITAFGGGAGNGFIQGGLLCHTPVPSQPNSATHWEAAALDSTIVRIGANIVFPAGSTGAAALIIPSASWGVGGVGVPAGVHGVFYANSWHVSYWDGAAEHIYTSGTYALPQDGVTVNRVEAFVDLQTTTLYLRLPDAAGRRIVKVTDARIAANISAFPNWELYEDNSGNNAVPAKYAAWWAEGSSGVVMGGHASRPAEAVQAIADQPAPGTLTSYAPASSTPVNVTAADVERARSTVAVPNSGKLAVIISDYYKLVTAGSSLIYSCYLQTHGNAGLGQLAQAETVQGLASTLFESKLVVMFDAIDLFGAGWFPGQLVDVVIAARSNTANSGTFTNDNSGRKLHILAIPLDSGSGDTTSN